MQWWVKDMVLNSHMKWRIFSTCTSEGLSQFVCGNALEKTIICIKIYPLLMEQLLTYQMMLHYFNGNTEIVTTMTLSSSTKRGDSDLVVNDEYEVIMIFEFSEFLGIFVRIGLTACSDLLFQQSVQSIWWIERACFFIPHLGINASWMSLLQHELHCAPYSTLVCFVFVCRNL